MGFFVIFERGRLLEAVRRDLVLFQCCTGALHHPLVYGRR
jgi:hypothetical protein